MTPARWTALLLPLLGAACGPRGSAAPTPAPASPGGPAAPTSSVASPAPAPRVTTRTLAAIGLAPTALDRGADPCDDFYQFACGGWMATTEIDADKPMAMRSFVDIEERNLAWEREALEQARAAPTGDPGPDKLGAFYGACMDEAAIEKAGLAAIRPLLRDIGAITDGRTLATALARLHPAGVAALFAFGSTIDNADAAQVIAGLDQPSLGMPDREYYLVHDAAHDALRARYGRYVASLLEEAGRTPAAATREAAEVIAFETALAAISLDKVARRDPKKTYNRIDRAGVVRAAPHLAWDAYWRALGVPEGAHVTVSSPAFLTGLDALLASTGPAAWRSYLTFRLLHRTAFALTRRLQDKAFAFESAVSGQPARPPRWKECVASTDEHLGDLLGQAFVRARFPGDSKAAAAAQVRAIAAAMAANLDALPWMDAATRARAQAKLAAMTYQIGYPRAWRAYRFEIARDRWSATVLAARREAHARDLAKIGRPVDRDDWQMTAATVNAYYDAQLNGMVFPAGVMQPPFYSVDATLPVNLGAMGMVVGHELTHGFDDEGAQFDASGNMTDWWQPATAAEFKARTRCVIDQYGAYEVQPGLAVNGELTVGENIADIGGLKLALAGYRALRAAAPDTVVADGFTEDQQFFLAFGQAWCAKVRPDFERVLASADAHAPARWRVNGTLQATPAFAAAFGCKAGARMAPPRACTVW